MIEIGDPASESAPVHFDQSVSLIHLAVDPTRRDEPQLTLYVHHSLADGHHEFSLVEELFSYYTDLVCTGRIRRVTVSPHRTPLESCARRTRYTRNSSGRGSSGSCPRCSPTICRRPGGRPLMSNLRRPLRVPMAGCQLSERETHDLIAFSRAHRISLNGLLSAVRPAGGVATSRQDEYPGAVYLSGRFAVRPVASGVCDSVHKPVGSGHLSRRDRPQHRCGEPRPGHRRDFPGRPVRRGDPAVAASLQSAIRRESTRTCPMS